MSHSRLELGSIILERMDELLDRTLVNVNGFYLVVEQMFVGLYVRKQPLSQSRKPIGMSFGFSSVHQKCRRWHFGDWIAFKCLRLHLNIMKKFLYETESWSLIDEAYCERVGRLDNHIKKPDEDLTAPAPFTIRDLFWNVHSCGTNHGCNHNLRPCADVELLNSRRASVLVENAPRCKRSKNKARQANRPHISCSHSFHRFLSLSLVVPEFYSGAFRSGGQLHAH